MSNIGEVVFDRSTDNYEDIWDDTELIRAYDRAHRHIRNRLRHSNSKMKKDSSSNTKIEKSSTTIQKSKCKKSDQPSSSSLSSISIPPAPLPINMITPPKDEQDALQSMLMSWYMAGYHAGQLAAKNWKKDS